MVAVIMHMHGGSRPSFSSLWDLEQVFHDLGPLTGDLDHFKQRPSTSYFKESGLNVGDLAT